MNKKLHTTHNIANKGFSGLRRYVARFKVSCNLIGNRPQSLTGHIVNVARNYKKRMRHRIILILMILFCLSCQTKWDVELWRQKIEGSDLSLYKFDAWGGRDTHVPGIIILDSLVGFKQDNVLEGNKITFLKSIPNKDSIKVIYAVRDNEVPTIGPYKIKDLAVKTTLCDFSDGTPTGCLLKCFDFKSFQETRDSLIFFSNTSRFVNEQDFDRISVPKGNLFLMTSNDNKKVAKVTSEKVIMLDNNKIPKICIARIEFYPIRDIKVTEFSDYGIYKPVK